MHPAIALTPEEVALLLEALEAYEYWELGDSLPRNNGSVFIPADLPPDRDPYWGPSPSPSAAELKRSNKSKLAVTSPIT